MANTMDELRRDCDILFDQAKRDIQKRAVLNVETPEKAAAYILTQIVMGLRGTGLKDDPKNDTVGAKIDLTALHKEITIWALAKLL